MVSLLKNPAKLGNFVIKNETYSDIIDDDLNQKMFIVVRNTKSTDNNHDYKINEGDVIKLGRIKLKVKFF